MNSELMIAIFTGIGAFGSLGTYFRLGILETKVESHDKDIRYLKGETNELASG